MKKMPREVLNVTALWLSGILRNGIWPASVGIAVLVAAGTPAQEPETTAIERVATGAAADLPVRERRVDEAAAKYMRAACEYLKSRPAFSVRAESTFEEVLRGGRRVQHSRGMTVVFKRPDRLRAQVESDKGRRDFYYDGESLAITDIDAKVYGRFDAPPTVEAMLDDAMMRFGVEMPLADLVSDDPCAALETNTERGWYLGQDYLPGGRYHHLLFSAPEVDLQVWVPDGEPPLLRKLVLTYKQRAGTPQYGLMLSDWNFAPVIHKSAFTFTPPADAREIEFVVAAPAGETPANAPTDTPASQE